MQGEPFLWASNNRKLLWLADGKILTRDGNRKCNKNARLQTQIYTNRLQPHLTYQDSADTWWLMILRIVWIKGFDDLIFNGVSTPLPCLWATTIWPVSAVVDWFRWLWLKSCSWRGSHTWMEISDQILPFPIFPDIPIPLVLCLWLFPNYWKKGSSSTWFYLRNFCLFASSVPHP